MKSVTLASLGTLVLLAAMAGTPKDKTVNTQQSASGQCCDKTQCCAKKP